MVIGKLYYNIAPYFSRTTSLGVGSRGEGGARQNLANRGLGSVEAASGAEADWR